MLIQMKSGMILINISIIGAIYDMNNIKTLNVEGELENFKRINYIYNN